MIQGPVCSCEGLTTIPDCPIQLSYINDWSFSFNWVWNLVSHTTGRMSIKDDIEEGLGRT